MGEVVFVEQLDVFNMVMKYDLIYVRVNVNVVQRSIVESFGRILWFIHQMR